MLLQETMSLKSIIFVALSIVCISEANAWFKKHHVNCRGAPGIDLSGCYRQLTPCNPRQKHPCGEGCKDRCCAKDVPFKGYYCFEKGVCGQFCLAVHGWWNTKGRCGCKSGLRCHKDHWYQAKKCKP